MKTAISIPTPLFDAAEQLARRLGVSRSELYQRAVRRFLEEHSLDIVREKLDEVYVSGDDTSRLDSAVEYLQNASLAEEDW
jgi:metal-responsive CopG/Arc/MetJ family transcriptional regulator